MPRPEFEEYFAELTRKLDALEAEVAATEVADHFEDLKRQIKVLYEAMRENHLLLETVLENSAASIYAKRKDGRYTYLNHEMEALCEPSKQAINPDLRRQGWMAWHDGDFCHIGLHRPASATRLC